MMASLPASQIRQCLIGVGDLCVRTLQVGIVLAYEVLKIDHERLRFVADGFLIIGQGLQSVVRVGQTVLVHIVHKFLRHRVAVLAGGFRAGDAFLAYAFAVFSFLLEITGDGNHVGAFFLLLLDRLNLLHVVFGLRLADFGLGALKLGEHHLHAAGGTEVDGVQDFGKTASNGDAAGDYWPRARLVRV